MKLIKTIFKTITVSTVVIFCFAISSAKSFSNPATNGGGVSTGGASTPSLSQVTAIGASTSDTLSLQSLTFTNATGTNLSTSTSVSSTRLIASSGGTFSSPGIKFSDVGIYQAGVGTMYFLTNDMGTRNTADTLTTFRVTNSSGSFTVPLTVSALLTASAGATSTSLQVNGPTTSTGKFYLTNPGAAVSGDQALCQSSTSSEVHINTGAATCTVSSSRFKHDIDRIDNALDIILGLNPVDYKRNSDGIEEHGLIAEEVEKIDPKSVFYEKDGATPRGVKYENLTAVLVKAIQEQQKEIDDLKARINLIEGPFFKLLRWIKSI